MDSPGLAFAVPNFRRGTPTNRQVNKHNTKRKKQTMKRDVIRKTGVILAIAAALGSPTSAVWAQEAKTVTGEVVDLMCYLDHGAKGEKHASCAQECIKSGGPVGLLTKDNQLYLVVGEHKPMNDKLASHAAKTVTLKGKIVERNGVKLIENAAIEK